MEPSCGLYCTSGLPPVISDILFVPGMGDTISMLSATTGEDSSKRTSITFDTDSGKIGIDNRCSVCMSNIKGDFVGELIKTFKYINQRFQRYKQAHCVRRDNRVEHRRRRRTCAYDNNSKIILHPRTTWETAESTTLGTTSSIPTGQ